MTDYTEAMNELSDALMAATPNSPEWIKARAALNALDDAQFAESQASFVNASRAIADAAAKLQAIIAGVKPNPASQFLDHIAVALKELTPIAKNVDALLSGEPATPLPGMAVTNEASFPSPGETIVPPLKLKAGTSAGLAPVEQRGAEQMIDDILQREGGFVNHPNDRGGPTNFGITLRTLAAWRSPLPVDVPDVRNLRIDEARQIYRGNYFTRPKIDQLPALIQPVMFDMSINHGPAAAIKLLQQVLNDKGRACGIDGGIGDETLRCAEAACKAFGKDLVNALVAKRISLFEKIVAGDESQRVFLAGWLNRAKEFAVA
ncbi:hypothetical protein BH11PSE10_BH11PSE10_09220 [soil metagenome]